MGFQNRLTEALEVYVDPASMLTGCLSRTAGHLHRSTPLNARHCSSVESEASGE